ncbi:MAG: MFS transporter [Cyanobacteria bacterium P01_H01_bin.35]
MRNFICIWFGQVISLIGSGLTSFALGVWVYQLTGSTIQFSLIYLFIELPYILVAPLSGVIADNWNRRWIMILADIASGISTFIVAILLYYDALKIWHIYLVIAFHSISEGFQIPAYHSIPTLLVKKKYFGQVNGMIQLSLAAEKLFSPVLAGILLEAIQLKGIILIDFATFGIALLTLLFVRFPKHQLNIKDKISENRPWKEISDAWNYICRRPGLFHLLMFFVMTNFTIGLAQVLITPMVLGFTDVQTLGKMLSIAGSGYLFGAILMTAWGRAKKKIQWAFCFEIFLGSGILLTGLRPSPILITVSGFLVFFSIPIIMGCANTIRQVKVAPEYQGRVFAIWGAIACSSFPLAYIIAGPLADYIFQPLLLEGGLLSNSIGTLIGVGVGRGIGLMFILIGILVILATTIAYQYPSIRFVEDRLPDIK